MNAVNKSASLHENDVLIVHTTREREKSPLSLLMLLEELEDPGLIFEPTNGTAIERTDMTYDVLEPGRRYAASSASPEPAFVGISVVPSEGGVF